MHTRREIGLLILASVLSIACCERASAAGANSTILLSRPAGLGALPAVGDGSSDVGRKAVSGDGRFVVFSSQADDLGVQDTLQHVWVRDTLSGTTTLVDRVPGGGAPGNSDALFASISRDGGTVCFLSGATNLVDGVTPAHVFVATLSTGAIVVADRATGIAGAVGDAMGGTCALDATGAHVAFVSIATNLVAGDTNDAPDVFVRDLVTSTTTRVSVDSLGAEAPHGGNGVAISTDGLKIAFESDDALVSGDTNDSSDVYVRNTQAGTLVRASVGTGGVQANGSSFDVAIDDSGVHVAFASNATNLDLGGDANNSTDVFWRDLGSDTTILVSRATGGAGVLGDGGSDAPAISGDGLGVAFESDATNLGAGAPPQGSRWIHLRRLGTNVTSLLSRASGGVGAPADRSATQVSLGTAPTVAVFSSEASNLDPDASGDFRQVFERDLTATPATTLLSRPTGTAARAAGVNNSFLPSFPGTRAISADGRLVVFTSLANGLDPAAASPFEQIFVRDTLSNITTLVSRGSGPAGLVANGDCDGAAIAADRSHVAFFSRATDLLDGEGSTDVQVYVRDLATGTMALASRADGPAGAFATGVDDSVGLDISADGTRVAFTAGGSLVSDDTNLFFDDVYVRDLVAGTTTLVSVRASGGTDTHNSDSPSLSDDGMRVAFRSDSTDLLGSGPITGGHVYVRDLVAGTTVLVDRDPQDGGPGDGAAAFPRISGAGTRVAFFDDQPLTEDVIPPTGAIYVRDLDAGMTLLASREDGAGGAATEASRSSSIDRDGTRIGWTGMGAGLPGGPDRVQVYLRDLAAGTTRLVSAVDGTEATPADAESLGVALDADGSCVAFSSSGDNLTIPAYPTQDFSQVYLRGVDDGCLAIGTTTTTLPPGSGTPITANVVVLRPGKVVKLVAKGLSGLPIAAADPRNGGGTLTVAGTTGSTSFALAASGWKAVGRGQPKGFKFKGGGCRVTLLRRRIQAACRGDTGGLQLPEPGPLDVTLIVEGEAYCAECGGKHAGRATRVFKRKACPAPATCP